MPQNNRDFVQRPVWGLDKRSTNKQPRASCMFISPYLPQDSKVFWILALTLKVRLRGCENQVENLRGNHCPVFDATRSKTIAQNRLQNHSRKLALNSPFIHMLVHTTCLPCTQHPHHPSRGILCYCPTTNEVFLIFLVYFNRMFRLAHTQRVTHSLSTHMYNVYRLVVASVTVASKFFGSVFYTNSRMDVPYSSDNALTYGVVRSAAFHKQILTSSNSSFSSTISLSSYPPSKYNDTQSNSSFSPSPNNTLLLHRLPTSLRCRLRHHHHYYRRHLHPHAIHYSVHHRKCICHCMPIQDRV